MRIKILPIFLFSIFFILLNINKLKRKKYIKPEYKLIRRWHWTNRRDKVRVVQRVSICEFQYEERILLNIPYIFLWWCWTKMDIEYILHQSRKVCRLDRKSYFHFPLHNCSNLHWLSHHSSPILEYELERQWHLGFLEHIYECFLQRSIGQDRLHILLKWG